MEPGVETVDLDQTEQVLEIEDGIPVVSSEDSETVVGSGLEGRIVLFLLSSRVRRNSCMRSHLSHELLNR